MSVLYSPLHNADRGESVRTSSLLDLSAKQNSSSVAPLRLNMSAPMAITEIDDDLDDRETVNSPYPGVDDGFFPNKRGDEQPDVENINPKHPRKPSTDVEIIPSHPKEPEPLEPPKEDPHITPRNGSGGGDIDDFDGKPTDPNRPMSPPRRRPSFPYAPGYGFPYGHDFEAGSLPDPESIPDVNVYQHKKTLAQGMMDLALFSANANQLRYVLESFKRHPYYFPSLALISISLILQVAVGIGLIWNAAYNVKDQKEICKANRINNFTVIGIFLVTVINVFISAFGVANPP